MEIFSLTGFGIAIFADSFTGLVSNPEAVEKIGTAIIGGVIAAVGAGMGI